MDRVIGALIGIVAGLLAGGRLTNRAIEEAIESGFVADVGDGPFAVANPELVETSGKWKFEEGCLSVPGRWWEFSRPAFARVRGFDPRGNAIEHAGDELMGRLLQHETDHLDGVLLIERLPKRLRKEALSELRDVTRPGAV